MSCKICKRNGCTRSFHTIEEQNDYDDRNKMSDNVDDLRSEIIELKKEITELNDLLEEQRLDCSS